MRGEPSDPVVTDKADRHRHKDGRAKAEEDFRAGFDISEHGCFFLLCESMWPSLWAAATLANQGGTKPCADAESPPGFRSMNNREKRQKTEDGSFMPDLPRSPGGKTSVRAAFS
jgi:hypothetical protein